VSDGSGLVGTWRPAKVNSPQTVYEVMATTVLITLN